MTTQSEYNYSLKLVCKQAKPVCLHNKTHPSEMK